MPSFQIALSPSKRTSGRFILAVRRALQKAFLEESKKRGITQSDIAREIGVHRSVINRELRGEKDLTLGRVAELAHAMGRKPTFSLPERTQRQGANTPQFPSQSDRAPTDSTEQFATAAKDVFVIASAI